MAFVYHVLPLLCAFCICINSKGLVRGDDRPFVAMDRIRKINQNLPGNGEHAVFVEEDIRLPSTESEAASGEFSNAIRFRIRLWPGGIVPYVLGQSIQKRPGHLSVLFEAMKVWEEKTCIRFVSRTNQFPYAYIHYGSDGCHSNIGALRSKPSALSLGLSCNLLSVAAHELGHLLGFGHEQNRPDRDEYVNILWENISPADYRIFRKQSHWIFHSLGVQYDYRSLMHYGAYTYSNNGRPTIESRDPKIKSFGSILPSELDIKQINLMYSCPEVPVFPDHFSIGSARPNLECNAINQSRDAEWGTRFLCYKPTLQRLNITWSQNGPITGLDCINTVMPFENAAELWNTSYLCVSRNSLLKFRWSVSRPIRGLGCLEVRERKRTRKGYFLCGVPRHKKIDGGWSAWSFWRSCTRQCGGGLRMRTRTCDNPLPQYGGAQCRGSSFHTISCNTQWCPEWPSWPSDFKFLYLSFTPKREECISIYERLQYQEWRNARLCWPSNKRQITIRWSDQGPVNHMSCIRVTQQEGWYQPNGWRDNYLCTKNVPYRFKWSTNGPIKGLGCIKWQNNRFLRSNLWQNNYLCADEYPVPTRAPRTGCLPGWQSFTLKKIPFCYLEVRYERHSWVQAQEYCREKNANLTSIVSEEEFKFLRRLTKRNIWLGLKMQRSWRWSDRSALSFKNWSPGEPNNGAGGPPEECVLSRGIDGKWNDFPCNIKFNFVCKMKGVIKT